jgi:hypothetical protein
MSKMPQKYTSCCLGVLVAGSLVALPAAAAEPVAPWGFNGSDTLELIMKDSIVNAAAAGVLASTGKYCVGAALNQACTTDADCTADGGVGSCLATNTLVYLGGGSGTAETAMLTGNKQSIGPMSRNFRPSVYTVSAAGVLGGTKPTWAPNLRNVLGLDAAIIVTAQSAGRVKNIKLPEITHLQAQPNNPDAGFTWGTTGSGYTQLLEVVLSGVDGSGSITACADPRRLQAVQDLAAAQGTSTGSINHIYRRDDNSGTTDTFKDRVAVGRFCNGAAPGNTQPGANPNLNNQDFDPIRRTCIDTTGTGVLPTTCTDLTTGAPCKGSDNNANCTQGLVVALSLGDNQTNLTDVTSTIANRVAADPDSIGYAGREAVRGPFNGLTNGPSINGQPFDDSIIRSIGAPYMLARRLFLQFANLDGLPGTLTSSNTELTFGGAPKVAAEVALYDYMTTEFNAGGRCHTDPVLKAHGFIPCLSDCTADIPSNTDNFCNAFSALDNGGYYAPVAAPPSACFPKVTGSGLTGWSYGTVTANASGNCCSDNSSVVSGGTCPAATGRLPVDAACSKDSDCTTGHTCSDYRAIGINQCH